MNCVWPWISVADPNPFFFGWIRIRVFRPGSGLFPGRGVFPWGQFCEAYLTKPNKKFRRRALITKLASRVNTFSGNLPLNLELPQLVWYSWKLYFRIFCLRSISLGKQEGLTLDVSQCRTVPFNRDILPRFIPRSGHNIPPCWYFERLTHTFSERIGSWWRMYPNVRS